ncbi:MAG: hypothetical protein AAF483_27220 [Planctomycetota bacterium]
MILVASIVVGVVVLALLYWLIFEDWDDFCEAVGYAFKPDIISWFQGEGFDDWWAEMKLYMMIALSGFAGYGTFVGLTKLFGGE